MSTACRVQVRIHSTEGLPKYSGFLDKTDQYVSVRLGPTSKQTKVVMNAGASASFEEDLIFDYNGEDALVFEVYDYDRLSADDHIGSGVFPLKTPLMGSGHWCGEVNLRSHTGRPTGRIKASVEFLQRVSALTSLANSHMKDSTCFDRDPAANDLIFTNISASVADRTVFWGSQQNRSLQAEEFEGLGDESTRSLVWSKSPSQIPQDLVILTGSTLLPPE